MQQPDYCRTITTVSSIAVVSRSSSGCEGTSNSSSCLRDRIYRQLCIMSTSGNSAALSIDASRVVGPLDERIYSSESCSPVLRVLGC